MGISTYPIGGGHSDHFQLQMGKPIVSNWRAVFRSRPNGGGFSDRVQLEMGIPILSNEIPLMFILNFSSLIRFQEATTKKPNGQIA